jgi:hypothetical protein
MTEAYEESLLKSRAELTNALVCCTDYKERVEQEIASLEQEVTNFWL